jgi:1,4-dihydroxy-2-naphthoyl-CoA hydrolase
MKLSPGMTPELWNQRTAGTLPGLLGAKAVSVSEGRFVMQMEVQPTLLAPNGYLHAASVIALADTACGFGCWSHLHEGANGFTTIELKSNFLATVREGTLQTTAQAVHIGRNTHVWDAPVICLQTGATLALFRCTQMVLWPKAGKKE